MSGESTCNLMCTKWHCVMPLSPAHPFPSSHYYSTISPYSLAYHLSYIILASLNKSYLGSTFCNWRPAHTFFNSRSNASRRGNVRTPKLQHLLTKEHVNTYQKSMLFQYRHPRHVPMVGVMLITVRSRTPLIHIYQYCTCTFAGPKEWMQSMRPAKLIPERHK